MINYNNLECTTINKYFRSFLSLTSLTLFSIFLNMLLHLYLSRGYLLCGHCSDIAFHWSYILTDQMFINPTSNWLNSKLSCFLMTPTERDTDAPDGFSPGRRNRRIYFAVIR